MNHAARFLPLVFAPFSMILLNGCGGTPAVPSVIHSPAPVIAVNVSIPENSVTLGPGETYHFVATVTGTANIAVSWNITGCTGPACGNIDSSGNYTAPASVPSPAEVSVVATSQADSGKSDTVIVRHEPIAVSVTPMETWLSPGGSTKFTASVRYDVNKRGVTWSLTCSNGVCGTLSNLTASSVLYTAPAAFPDPPTVTLKAISGTDPNKSGTVGIGAAARETLAAGDYAFFFKGWEISISGGYYWPFGFTVAGHFHADGAGNIVDGIEDINSIRGVFQSVPFTGAYVVGPDRRGVLTIVDAKQTATYTMVLEPSGTRAKFIRLDGLSSDMPVSGAGYIELQDNAAFSLSALNGDYAMGISGAGSGHDWRVVDAVGRFTVSPEGALTTGQMDRITPDYTKASNSSVNLILAGSLAGPSSETGRGTATFAISGPQSQTPKNLNFAYYVVSADKLLLIQTDARNAEDYTGSVLSGEARRQHGPFSAASFNGPTIFSMAGLNRDGYGAYFEHVEVGQMVSDGSASIAGVVDDNGYPHPAVTNQAFNGTYSVASDGRSELQLGAGYVTKAIAYFYGPNQAFLMESNPGSDALFGNVRPQAAGPFVPTSIAGTFLTVTAPPTSEEAVNECGVTTFDGEKGATSTINVNSNLSDDSDNWLQHFDLTGTYDVAPNGRGTLTFSSQERSIVFWIASPTELVGNAAMSSDGWYYIGWAAPLEFTR